MSHRSTLIAVGLFGLLALLAGCEAESTPLPAFVAASPTAPPATATPGPLRYALTADAALNGDLPLLEDAATVVVLDADAPTDMGSYELMAGYGDRPGWARSPVVPRVSLAVGAQRAPLDADSIAALVVNAVDAPALVAAHAIGGSEALSPAPQTPTTRTLLANAGWPDGFDVTLGHSGLPGSDAVVAALDTHGLTVLTVVLPPDSLLPALADGRANLALVVWTTDAERDALAEAVGAARVVDLYTLPIAFQAVDGLQLSFTPGGWPLARR